jgi:hypothetical protein
MDQEGCFGSLSGPTEARLKPGSNPGSRAWQSDAQLREGTLSLLDFLLDFGPTERRQARESLGSLFGELLKETRVGQKP